MQVNDSSVRTAVYVLFAGVFAADLLLGSGVAVGVLYVVPVLAALPSRKRGFLTRVAVAATVLTSLGAYLPPGEPIWGIAGVNRLLALVAIWVAAVLGRRGGRAWSLRHMHAEEATVPPAAGRAGERDSERRFESILEAAPDGFIWTDERGRITLVNRQTEDLFGYKREELMGQSVDLLVPERFRPNHSDQRNRYLAHPASRPMGSGLDLYGRKKDGSEFPVEIMLSPLRTVDGVSVVAVVRDVSERKIIERSLRDNEQRFRELTENMRDVVYLTDLEKSRFLYLNAQFEDLFEMTRAEAYEDYLAPLKRVHPDDRPPTLSAIHKQKQGIHQLEFDYRVLRTDGTIRWVHVRTFPIRDIEGKAVRIAGILQDVTREKRAEAALRESEERFRQLADQMQDCIYLRDPASWRLIYINAACERVYGRPAEFFLDDPDAVRGIMHPDDLPILDSVREKQRRGEFDLDDEYRVVFPDGSIRWVRGRIFPIVDEQGRTVHVAGIHTEITQRKNAAERLQRFAEELEARVEERTAEVRQREADLAEAQRIGGVGSWTWDIRENRVECSDEIYRLLGVARESRTLDVEDLLDRIHPEDRPTATQSFQTALRERKPYSLDFRILPENGKPQIIHARGELQFDEQGQPVRMAGTIHNISERRALEERLAQSKKLEAVGQLAGGIAHDFNNLMTVVGGYSEMLARDVSLRADVKGKLDSIRAAAERASALTQKLLAYSRKLLLHPTTVDLNRLVEGALPEVRSQATRPVEILKHLAPDLALTFADPRQVREVFLSLTANSCEAMPRGGTLTVATSNRRLEEPNVRDKPEVKTGRYVVLSISDTGIGMDKVTLESIFEPFFTTKDKSSGAGMGLASVYGIVKQSGGFIEVESSPGKGTRVDVYLPAHEAQAAGAAAV